MITECGWLSGLGWVLIGGLLVWLLVLVDAVLVLILIVVYFD